MIYSPNVGADLCVRPFLYFLAGRHTGRPLQNGSIILGTAIDSLWANFLVMLEFEPFGDLLWTPLFLGEFFFKEGKELRC